MYAAVALHPTRTASVTDDDYAEIERLAADPRVVAVGETGLDYYWDHSPPDRAAGRVPLAHRARQARSASR